MKAAVCTRYGPPEVLRIAEVPQPVPAKNEVLIKIHAAGLTAGDCEMRRFDVAGWVWLPLRLYMGVFRPRVKILGQEYSGQIEAVGESVRRYKPGDQVFGPTQMSLGAHAEYICLPENYPIAIKPSSISFEAAATLSTGGLNALHFLRKAGIKKGDRLLIVGAGGSIGTYALQLALSQGAKVDCVDSAEKLDMLSKLGAHRVFDYRKEDFSSSGEKYDAIIEVAGKTSVRRCLQALTTDGRLIITNPGIKSMLLALRFNQKGGRQILNSLAGYKVEDLDYLKKLIIEGAITAVIDKQYSLDQISEAHRYVDDAKKKGNVVIVIASDATNSDLNR